jgi:hypothetical protein
MRIQLCLALLLCVSSLARADRHHRTHRHGRRSFIPAVLKTKGYIPSDTYYRGFVPDDVYVRALYPRVRRPNSLLFSPSYDPNIYYFQRFGTRVRYP